MRTFVLVPAACAMLAVGSCAGEADDAPAAPVKTAAGKGTPAKPPLDAERFPLVATELNLSLIQKHPHLEWAADASAFASRPRRIGVLCDSQEYVASKLKGNWQGDVLSNLLREKAEDDIERLTRELFVASVVRRLQRSGFRALPIHVKTGSRPSDIFATNASCDAFLLAFANWGGAGLRIGFVLAKAQVVYVLFSGHAKPIAAGWVPSFSLIEGVSAEDGSKVNVAVEKLTSSLATAVATDFENTVLAFMEGVWGTADVRKRLAALGGDGGPLHLNHAGETSGNPSVTLTNSLGRPSLFLVHGPRVRRFELAPDETRTIELPSGTYDFALVGAGPASRPLCARAQKLEAKKAYRLGTQPAADK